MTWSSRINIPQMYYSEGRLLVLLAESKVFLIFITNKYRERINKKYPTCLNIATPGITVSVNLLGQ